VIGIDASPLAWEPRRGVARALSYLLQGLRAVDALPGVRLFAPERLPADLLPEGAARRVVAPDAPPRGPAAWRRTLRGLVAAHPVDAFLSPWSAFPRLDVPVVATVHELPFVRAGPVEGLARTLAHRVWLARDARHAAAIVVPSGAVRDDVLRLHPRAAERVVVVPHGFDPAPWEAEARGLPRATRPPYGVLVGARNRRKGLDTFLGALPALADLRLRWILVGAPDDRRTRRALAAVRSAVEVVAEADEGLLRTTVAAARLLVYPSLSEGFGFPPLEAMAAGVPVVASSAGSIPEVVAAAARTFPPRRPEALAAAIREVATDEALRGRLVAAGRARARAFPVEDAARRTTALLARVARGAGASP
jgi:glycosyltransferase involved in cell wall biosynthesis